MPRRKNVVYTDPFLQHPKFSWDYRYVFDTIQVNSSHKALIQNFFGDISISPTLPKNPKKFENLHKTLENDKFNNIYHVFDEVLSMFVPQSEIKHGML
jgi:ssDNA-specific exonuclease RecJ